MRFYQEFFGIIWEFNSFKEWLAFQAGQLTAVIIVLAAAYLICLAFCPSLLTLIGNIFF